MRSYYFRSIPTPVLVIAGAAFLFMAAGCGRQTPTTPSGTPRPADAGRVSDTVPTSEKKADDPELYKPEESSLPKIELTQEGVEITWTEKGVVRMKATAKESRFDGAKRMGSLKNFSAVLYESGKPTTTMTAPNVLCDTVLRTVMADGGVVLTSMETKSVIKSKWMKWFSKEQRVVGNGGVQAELIQPDSSVWNMSGSGFVADTALKSVVVRQLVKGQDF